MNRIYTLKLTINDSNGCLEEPSKQISIEVTDIQIHDLLKTFGSMKSINAEIVLRLANLLIKNIEHGE